eukprot:scaffold385033_cov22-Prasinocladus_malaysianus.AAC.1
MQKIMLKWLSISHVMGLGSALLRDKRCFVSFFLPKVRRAQPHRLAVPLSGKPLTCNDVSGKVFAMK